MGIKKKSKLKSKSRSKSRLKFIEVSELKTENNNGYFLKIIYFLTNFVSCIYKLFSNIYYKLKKSKQNTDDKLKKSKQNTYDKLKKSKQSILNIYNYSSELTPRQKKVLDYANHISSKKSNELSYLTKKKFLNFGFTIDDFDNIIEFIKNDVNVIIHFDPGKILSKLYDDSFYKNLFETNHSNGSRDKSARMVWENNLFNNIYDNNTPNSERVKYGCLHISGNKKGDKNASHFGNSYIVLKKNNKKRVTFIWGDSGGFNSKNNIFTFNHFDHLFLNFSEHQLESMIKQIKKKNDFIGDYIFYNYIECQIHGLIDLTKDIELLMINNIYKENQQIVYLLKKFEEKFGCPYKFIDE